MEKSSHVPIKEWISLIFPFRCYSNCSGVKRVEKETAIRSVKEISLRPPTRLDFAKTQILCNTKLAFCIEI